MKDFVNKNVFLNQQIVVSCLNWFKMKFIHYYKNIYSVYIVVVFYIIKTSFEREQQ